MLQEFPQELILRYPELSEHSIHGFTHGSADVNFFACHQNKYGLPSEDAIKLQEVFLESLGIKDKPWLTQGSVGGTKILEVTSDNFLQYAGYTEGDFLTRADGFDSVYTMEKGLPLCVGYADCAQILVAGEDFVGIIHGGRDSLDKKIIHKFINEISDKVDPNKLYYGMSPHIRATSYVHTYLGMERADEWVESGAIVKIPRAYSVNLSKIIYDDFASLGIPRDHVKDLGLDTAAMGYEAALNGNTWFCSLAAFENVKDQYPNLKRGTSFCAIMLPE